MAAVEGTTPLIVCMENANGQEVSLNIEPTDDFQIFLDKAKKLLGYDVDLNSITQNRPVSLNENIYQFLINAEQHELNPVAHPLDSLFAVNDDLLYVLDEGSHDQASKIHFDSDDACTDLSTNNIPFVKYKDVSDGLSPSEMKTPSEVKKISILKSPKIERNASARSTDSPKLSFVNSLPFQLIQSVDLDYESFIDKNIVKVDNNKKCPQIIKDKRYEISRTAKDPLTSKRCDDLNSLTREEILNMLKDSPVKTQPYEKTFASDKPKHIRKTDPSRPVFKNVVNTKLPKSNFDINTNSNEEPNHNCYMCELFINNEIDKIYIFDNEDQKFYRSSPLKQPNTLKIICEGCLDKNFKIRTDNIPNNRPLRENEYVVIRNKEQYVYKKILPNVEKERPKKDGEVTDAEAIVDRIESNIFKQCKELEFFNIEILSDDENTNDDKSNGEKSQIDENNDYAISNESRRLNDDKDSNNDRKCDDNGESDEGKKLNDRTSSDDRKSDDAKSVDLVEIDEEDCFLDKDGAKSSDIENIEGADDNKDVEFLDEFGDIIGRGKNIEMKCRFCNEAFVKLTDVIEHGKQHYLKEEDVFPCPICEYGYQTFPWLRGHIRTKHSKPKYNFTFRPESKNVRPKRKSQRKRNSTDSVSDSASPRKKLKKKAESPNKIRAYNTRSSKRTDKNDTPDAVDTSKTADKLLTLLQEGYVKEDDSGSDGEGIWILDSTDDKTKDTAKCGKTRKRTHHCSPCGKSYSSVQALKAHRCCAVKKHLDTEVGEILYMPSEEDFLRRAEGRKRAAVAEFLDDDGFIKPGKYRPHKAKVTSDPRMVTCHDCCTSFTSKVRLKFHMQFHEPKCKLLTADGKYRCSACNDVCDTETGLFDHVHFAHDKRKRWICPVQGCGKTFFLRANLTKHSRSHTDTRRYACGTCGKRFLDKQTLDEHLVTHLKIKPFQCHICLKHLTRRSRLRMHLRAHEEGRVESPSLVRVCRICDRAFKDNEEAQEHVQSSTFCLAGQLKERLKEEDCDATRLSPTSGVVTTKATADPDDTELEIRKRRRILKDTFEPKDPALAEEMLQELSEDGRRLIKIVEIKKAFRCEFCEDVFYLHESLNTHRSIHSGVKNPFTCHICHVSFPTYSRCATHKTTHGFYKRSLDEFKKQGDETTELEHGVKREMGGPSETGIVGYGGFPVVKHFLCQDCGRSYLQWTYLQVHRRMKHTSDKKTYECDKCNETFPNSWSLAYHKRKVHRKTEDADCDEPKNSSEDMITYSCRDCEELFHNKSALYKHRRLEHLDTIMRTGKQGLFSCAQCGKRYASKPGLEAHMRTHDVKELQNAPYACAKCGETFELASNLMHHVKQIHANELQCTCTNCGKAFCSRAELAIHIRTHTSVRPHLCPVCGHGFRTLSMRNEHIRIHTDERPFPCDVCGMAFRRSTAMRNHRLIHTGVRPFVCPRCPKRFRIKSDLRMHMKVKHPEQILILEMVGLNPQPEDILQQLRVNNILPQKVIDIAKISLPKGSQDLKAMTKSELSGLVDLQRQDEESAQWSERTLSALGVSAGRTQAYQGTVSQYQEQYQPRRGRGIARHPRRTPFQSQNTFQDPSYFPQSQVMQQQSYVLGDQSYILGSQEHNQSYVLGDQTYILSNQEVNQTYFLGDQQNQTYILDGQVANQAYMQSKPQQPILSDQNMKESYILGGQGIQQAYALGNENEVRSYIISDTEIQQTYMLNNQEGQTCVLGNPEVNQSYALGDQVNQSYVPADQGNQLVGEQENQSYILGDQGNQLYVQDNQEGQTHILGDQGSGDHILGESQTYILGDQGNQLYVPDIQGDQTNILGDQGNQLYVPDNQGDEAHILVDKENQSYTPVNRTVKEDLEAKEEVVLKDVAAEELSELLGGGFLTADGRGVYLNNGQYIEFDSSVVQQSDVYTLQRL